MSEKERPLISVIIPVYNVEKYLRRCLDSVLNQAYNNLEIILIDDGSKDSSGSICDEYALKDNRIRVIHKENGGLSSARNAGLDIMQGEYIVFVDSDDVIHKNMVGDMYAASIENRAQLAVCQFQEFYSDFVPDISNEQVLKYKILERNDAFLLFDSQYGFVMLSACNKLYEKSIFEKIRFPLGRKCEDTAIIYKVVFNAERVAVLENKFYYYFMRENSIMHSSNRPTDDAVLAYDDFIQFCRDNIEEETFKNRMVSMLLKRRADTILEDYYYSVKRKTDKSELKHRKELYYNMRSELKCNGVLRPQYRVFELSPFLFCICVEIYYRLIGRNTK